VVYGQTDKYPTFVQADFDKENYRAKNPFPFKAHVWRNIVRLNVQTVQVRNNTKPIRSYIESFDLYLNDHLLGRFTATTNEGKFAVAPVSPSVYGFVSVQRYDDPDLKDVMWTSVFNFSGIPASFFKLKNTIIINNIKTNTDGNVPQGTHAVGVFASYDDVLPAYSLGLVTATPGCGTSVVKWNSVPVEQKYLDVVAATIDGVAYPYSETSTQQIASIPMASGSREEDLILRLGSDIIASTTVTISPLDPLPTPSGLQASTKMYVY
jgi:hypothetical protein